MLPTSRSPLVRTPRARRVLVAAGVGALVVTLSPVSAPVDAAPARAGSGEGLGAGAPSTGGLPRDLSARLSSRSAGADSIPQTSDGVRGELVAPDLRRSRAAARTITNTVTAQWSVAPGVSFARFDRNDSVRGNVRGQLLVLDMATPGLSVDYTGPKAIAKVQTVDKLTARGGGIAGINGDFFDIGDTGASLGVAAGRSTGLIKGPASGWNTGFWVDTAGVPHVGELPVTTTIKKHVRMKVDALNPPSVPQGGIGAYDADWGRTLNGFQVTDQQKRRVRQVVIRGGKVVSNRTSLTRKLALGGKVLIGRGKGADKLRKLRVGSRTGIVSSLTGNPPVAITGNKALLINKVRQVIDDTEMHPRTAIGIDRDTNRILMLVVDGRQAMSRGMTMVELAQLMSDLGADDALNLDGGGSSTMLALDANGVMGVQNAPSDGTLRKVANGLVVDYVRTDPVPAPSTPTIFPTPVPTPTPTPTPTASPTASPTVTPTGTPGPTLSPPTVTPTP